MVDSLYGPNEKEEQEILQSGDLERIADLPLDVIFEHFGEDSPEHIAKQRRSLSGSRTSLTYMVSQVPIGPAPESKPEPTSKPAPKRTYNIPRMTEHPLVTAGMTDTWIRRFHKMNDMSLPKGYASRSSQAKRGMLKGMMKQYGITRSDVTGPDHT